MRHTSTAGVFRHEVLQGREQLKKYTHEKVKSKGTREGGEKEAEVGERRGKKEAAGAGREGGGGRTELETSV